MAPEQALLDLVESDRRQKCDAIMAEAQGRGSALRRQAHAEARALMRRAFHEERLRREARVDAARANLQTRRRLALQRRAAALLVEGWQRLPGELLRRWQAAPSRERWVAAVVAQARSSLFGSDWRITHAPDWPGPERDAAVSALTEAGHGGCALTADPRIRAGLAIGAGGNVVDGTLDGLLSDRAEIGSWLLHLLEGDSP